MKKKRSNHVIPIQNSEWVLVKSGAEKPFRRFKSKTEAISFGNELSKTEQSRLYVHKSDGRIEARHSYSPEDQPLDKE
ncbi:DUF2188 domain-containing protein [Algoriphagus sp. H41]|uniref:DUF2188 domain-containing protein n=1 Tax=Algoriphagus oliviformis TaxID=2811231 RepID=A0ABS3BY48_9BACT|nr:DUF2188 domain-containing protein [Algoriphagus oliviformis]